jgi:hypothetical protein
MIQGMNRSCAANDLQEKGTGSNYRAGRLLNPQKEVL